MPDLVTPSALRDKTTLRLGGTPQRWCTVRTLAELAAALEQNAGSEILVLGGGSNLVCNDGPFPGAVIEVNLRGTHVASHPPTTSSPQCFAATNVQLNDSFLPPQVEREAAYVWVHVAAGERWDDVVAAACRWGLGGIECLSGIPGKAGATPIQNVGAYGQEVSDTLWSVTCMHRSSRELVSFSASECELSYRNSRFKTKDLDAYVVVEVVFRLAQTTRGTIRYGELSRLFDPHAPPTLTELRLAVLKTRASKSMLQDPSDPNGRNCGSFFLNPIVPRERWALLQATFAEPVPHFEVDAERVKIPAAWLIDRAGFARGHRVGNVGLSTKHTLCVVAHEAATAKELLEFAHTISDAVDVQFGIQLHPEPVLVGLRW